MAAFPTNRSRFPAGAPAVRALTRRDRAPLFVLAGVLLLAFHGAWFPGRSLFARDLTYVFHPMHVWTAESLAAGRLPLWNPYVSGGVPWLGQPQTGVFYPGDVLFWLFPFAVGLKLFTALHFFLSALGGYLWARASGGSVRAALAAGLLWSLNGFWRARVEFPSLLAVLAWTPWLGLFFRKAAWVPSALAASLALTAGYWPQLLWGGLFAFAAAARLRRWPGLARAGAMAAALGGAALLPGLELMSRSDRAAGLATGVAGQYAFSPRHWAGLAWPWASAMGEFAYTGEKFFWAGCFFTGFAGAALAVLAFIRTPGRRKWVWAGFWTVGAALTLGSATPLFRLLLWTRVRYPGQQAFWMTAAVLAAVTAGARHWERGMSRRAAGLLLAVVAAELLAYGSGMVPTVATGYFHRRAAWIETVQKGPDGGRLFMTPRAIADTRAEGAGWEDTWRRLREKGLNLSTLPYHLRNLNPHGFALNPASTERLLADLYGRSSYEDARPLLDRLSVRWIASPVPLPAAGLRLAGRDPWYLYERIDAPRFAAPEMYDPGWVLSGGGKSADDGGLLAPRGPVGGRFLFRPRSFRIGLLLSLAAWTALAAWGLLRAGCL